MAPVLSIEGHDVEVGDDFLTLPPDKQNATVEEIAKSMVQQASAGAGPAQAAAPKAAPISASDLARSAAHGVPIIGGLVDKAEAATEAALAPAVEPFLTPGPNTLTTEKDFSGRYAKAQRLQEQRTGKFETEHPYADLAAKLAGGVGATVPLVAAAPAMMGATGTVPQMAVRGAASGAALSGADAEVRGQDVGNAMAEGGMIGAAGGPLGKAIGSIASKLRGATEAPGPAIPHNTMNVAGVEVPIPPQDLSAQSTIENARKGASGDPAQAVVAQADAEAKAALDRANEAVAATIGGDRTAPAGAASHVVDEVTNAEARRLASEQALTSNTEAEGRQLAQRLSNNPAEAAVDAGSGAEIVGAGVNAKADEARRGFQELYKGAGAAPGEFSPGAFQGVGEEIRQGLSSREAPIFVDDENTKRAAKALRDIDTNVDLGNFQNLAAPRADLEGAGPAWAGSDAEKAYSDLRAKGVPPDRAKAAVSNLPGAEDAPKTVLEPHDVATPDGGSVRVVPKVVEASSIKTSADPGYDPSLQPRNRARAASSVQVNDMAQNLNPQRLGLSSEADRGAPILGPDGMTESGNGRVLAIRQAYADNGPAAQRYRNWLQSQGVDTAGMKEPVLVRERATPMTKEQRKAFTVSANQSSTLSLSAPERALADSRALSPETLSLIRNPVDLAAVENRDFVRQFMQSLPAAERGALMTANGDLSAEGLSRVRNAVLAKAYGDSSVLGRIAESTHDDVRSISAGLEAAAPEWAQLRAAVAAGAVPKEMDATAHLIDAVERTARLRAKGTSLAEGLAQRDAFTTQSPESEALQRLFYDADGKKAASGAKVGEALRHYAQEAAKVDAGPGLNLGMAPVTSMDVIGAAARRVKAPGELAAEVKAAAQEAAAAKPAPGRAVDMRAVDNARKRLVGLYRAAKDDPNGRADARALQAIMTHFDDAVQKRLGTHFSGDPAVGEQFAEARAAFSKYRQTFHSRGRGDPVGQAVEKILGRFSDTKAQPDEIMKLAFGDKGEPGGGNTVRVAQRIRSILGETSPEWGRYKQALFDHVVGDRSAGAAKQADRIEQFLTQPKGRGLAAVTFSADERSAMAGYARNLRGSEPAKLSDMSSVDKQVARIAGRDGFPPMSTSDLVDHLYGAVNAAGSKSGSLGLMRRLKADMTPEGFDQVRQGMWSHLTERGEGLREMGPQKMAQNIYAFLNGKGAEMSMLLYTGEQRAAMKAYADALTAHVPPAGATNPSGTAPMLTKIVKSGAKHALPMLGFMHGGVSGALVGHFGQKVLSNASNASAARTVRNLIYRPQPGGRSVDPRFAKASVSLSRGAVQGQN